MRLDVLLRRAGCPGCALVNLDYFADLWAFLAWTDSDLDARALRQAAVPCCLQDTNVEECIGCADDVTKPKPFSGLNHLTMASTDSDPGGALGLILFGHPPAT